jgi:hypothetical protein
MTVLPFPSHQNDDTAPSEILATAPYVAPEPRRPWPPAIRSDEPPSVQFKKQPPRGSF